MISLGLAGAVLCGTMGCSSMTKAQKTALFGQSLSILGSINTPGNNTVEGNRAKEILSTSGSVITNQAMMQHDLEYANAGKSQIIVNNNTSNYSNQSKNNYPNTLTPAGFFMYKNFIDFNNDGMVNGNEFIGLNEPVYDLRNLNALNFSFYGEGKSEYGAVDLELNIYSLEDGELINSFDQFCQTWKIQNFNCESKSFPKSGKYKAVLNAGKNKSFYLDFEVIK
jgi:hypothetical protein